MNSTNTSTPTVSRAKVDSLFLNGLEKFSKPGIVLDLGCGNGTNVIYAAEHGWKAHGCDIDENAIVEAQRCYSEKLLLNVDVCTIPIQQYVKHSALRYDLVTCIDALSFISPEEIPEVLRLIGERLNPGGIVVLRVFTRLECIVKQGADSTFFDEGELRQNFSGFNIIMDRTRFLEDPGHEGYPKPHQHHVEEFIAQKPF